MNDRIPPVLRSGVAATLLLATLGCGDSGNTLEPPECIAEVKDIGFSNEEPVTLVRLRDGVVISPTFANACGDPVTVAPNGVTWSSSDPAIVTVRSTTGRETPSAFVQAIGFGTATVTATAGAATGEIQVRVVVPPPGGTGFTVLDVGEVGLYTTDLWVHGDYAYNGSGPWSCGDAACESLEGWLFTWRLQPDGGLEKADSLALPAVMINDVKVSADGSFAVASQELGGAADNGIVLLDLTDPASPTILTRFTEGLDGGVHNVWIERIDGRDYVFVAENGTGSDAGLHIVDVTDRTAPIRVAGYWAGSSSVHDVYVRDGLAFVSHWDAGLVILDVGDGRAGGAPDDPVEVGRVVTEGGKVHNAWYWPAGGKVFVGEERFPPPEQIDEVGVVHVVDVADLANPVEIARFGVPGSSPHNFWMDEERGVLFAAWYTNGLRAIDVTGTLSGDLAAQGRELGWVLPSGPHGAASIWAPQLHRGRIYMSDIYNGLWSVRFDR